MILAFDTFYVGDTAKTVCIGFENWEQEAKHTIYTEHLQGISPYQSGAFYKRELPCILSLFQKINPHFTQTIIVDGYVFLDDEQKLGLGGHLYRALDQKIPVIGVAKNNFMTIHHQKRELCRGKSQKPLYITSVGIEIDQATERIRNMEGEYRIPTLLKKLDYFTRHEIPESEQNL